MPTNEAGFTAQTLKFLRALKRHNTREWFHEHRADYDRHVHGPMVTIVERLAEDLPRAAPGFQAGPKLSLFRPWRDTRFSANKAPLKTNVAAVFPYRGMARMEGASLYFEVAPEHVWIGGGLYSPDSATLHAVRAHIAERHRELARLVAAPAFKKHLGSMQGEQATRMPRGFAAAHPAADMLRHKQFLAAREEKPDFAARPDFYPRLLATFAAMAPFVAFLNQPILELRRAADRDPLAAGLSASSRRRRP
ncbi:MAG TPA: DUF2461 domain-containing protein [Vicinamibacterales bacterium]|nr:DUF2461 domain-containing protein [Vicinamibacterales bacterium]